LRSARYGQRPEFPEQVSRRAGTMKPNNHASTSSSAMERKNAEICETALRFRSFFTLLFHLFLLTSFLFSGFWDFAFH
jgi:hypothetical protein